MNINNIPIQRVVRVTDLETGLYKRLETRYLVDAPIYIFLEKVIGLQIAGRDPFFLKFDTATQEIIDGKTYTVLISESFEPYEEQK